VKGAFLLFMSSFITLLVTAQINESKNIAAMDSSFQNVTLENKMNDDLKGTNIAEALNFYPSGIISSSSGFSFTLAIDELGYLWAWGSNGSGQLGDNTWARKSSPVSIKNDTKFQSISAGTAHSLGIDVSGCIWSWGRSDEGQVGDGTRITRNTPVKIMIGVKFKSISTDMNHSLAIDVSGNLWAWGYNCAGQVGDGTLISRLSPVKIMDGIKFKCIATGGNHSLAIDVSGNLWAWGYNNAGQIGDGTFINRLYPVKIMEGTKFISVSAGFCSSLAIDSSGKIWAWGDNSHGQLGDNTRIQRITPVKIKNDTKFSFISTGGFGHSLAIDILGNLWAWGENGVGQLGDGTNIPRNSPVPIKSGTKFKIVSAGWNHSSAVDLLGNIWTWGESSDGQLGNGFNLLQYWSNVPVWINNENWKILLSTNTVNLAYSEGSSASINVTSNTSWNAKSNQTWVVVTPTSKNGDGTLSVKAKVNPTITSRSAIVTVSATNAKSQTINITQAAGSATLSISTSTLNFSSEDASPKIVNIYSNANWAVSINQSWLNVNQKTGNGNGTLIFSVAVNPTVSIRTAIATISATGVASKTITITQAGRTAPLIPENLNVDKTTISNGDSKCFNAYKIITVAGSGTSVVFASGSSVNVIAGQYILFLPGFHSVEGSYVDAHITTTSSFCETESSSIVSLPVEKSISEDFGIQDDINPISVKSVKVYPNPNNGRFNLVLENFEGICKIKVYNTLGATIYEASANNTSNIEINLPYVKKGIYFVSVISGKEQFNKKVVIK
jgi:alpha-tubulin suppressor-like RCC1 family protein